MKNSFPKRAFLALCLALSLALFGGCSCSASSTSETILNTISHIDAVDASKRQKRTRCENVPRRVRFLASSKIILKFLLSITKSCFLLEA